jgi:hypothetical protein
MINTILIFGYGKWAKKIVNFLKEYKVFDEVYIKTSSKFFKIYPRKKVIEFENFENIIKTFKYFHICTPVKSHYEIVKINNLNNVKLIIEKPLVKKKIDLKKIKPFFNSNKIIINYIDLYNPQLLKISKKIHKVSNLNIEFGNKTSFKNKNECLNEWLDHPLAIILFLFKKFGKFQLINCTHCKIKNKYYEILDLRYIIKNVTIHIKINNKFPASNRIISITNKSKINEYNFNSKIKDKGKNLLNKNNLNFLYEDLKSVKNNFFQKFNFHQKIFEEKQKIIMKINEN